MSFTGDHDFFRQLAAAIVLVPLTLLIQNVGMAALIMWLRGHFARNRGRHGLGRCVELMMRVTSAMILLHFVQILFWTAFYRWKCLPNLESAFYFSATSYSTVGYGDLVLPGFWRLLGPLESVTGVLMCGLSASLLFAVVARLVGHEDQFLPPLEQAAQVTAPAQAGGQS